MTYTLQVRSSEKFKDQNKRSAKYKQKRTIMQAHTHIYIYITKCNLTTSNHRLKAKAAADELRDILSGKMSSTQSIPDQHHEHQSIQTQEKRWIASLINRIMNTNLSKHSKNTE